MPEQMTEADLIGQTVRVFVPHLGMREGKVVLMVGKMVMVKFDDQWGDWYHVRQVYLR